MHVPAQNFQKPCPGLQTQRPSLLSLEVPWELFLGTWCHDPPSPSQRIKHLQTRLWYPCTASAPIFKHSELVLVFSFSIFAIFAQVVDFPLIHPAFELDRIEHVTMFLHLAMFSGFALCVYINHKTETLLGVVQHLFLFNNFSCFISVPLIVLDFKGTTPGYCSSWCSSLLSRLWQEHFHQFPGISSSCHFCDLPGLLVHKHGDLPLDTRMGA
ncbi:uncharacterized protein J3R85_009383 [Psidium guajava]|nr:uncharacterized protein J3R85_009383 [Psidium guajava]